MGERKPGSESRQRQKVLGVRLSRDELTVLSLAAKREGKTLAAFLRDAGLARAQGPGRRRRRPGQAT